MALSSRSALPWQSRCPEPTAQEAVQYLDTVYHQSRQPQRCEHANPTRIDIRLVESVDAPDVMRRGTWAWCTVRAVLPDALRRA